MQISGLTILQVGKKKTRLGVLKITLECRWKLNLCLPKIGQLSALFRKNDDCNLNTVQD